MAYRYHRFFFYVPFFFSVKKAAMVLKCSQSPICSQDRLDIPRLTVTAILIFKCTEGTGVGDYSSSPLSSFDTHARWQPVTRKVLDLDDLTEKQRTVNSLDLCCHTFFQRKKKKERKKTVMPQRCHRPACLWGVLFKMATTTIFRKTKRLRSIS